ncbi:MAG: DUF5069 domain-containing protein [Limisphaerales bacterium]
MAQNYPTIIPGLRKPIRLGQGHRLFWSYAGQDPSGGGGGKLPEDWQASRGPNTKTSFDGRCCRFLHIDYAALEAETLKDDKSDEQLLAWAFTQGRQPSEDEIEVWNGFMSKRGWRDAITKRLNERLAKIGLPPGTVETMFEFIDLDEGRIQPGAK